MIQIPFRLEKGLLYLPITLQHRGKSLKATNCIFDTGSAGTVFDADLIDTLGLRPTPASRIKQMIGVGGVQRVVMLQVDEFQLGTKILANVEIEVGDLHSHFHVDGILGTNIIRLFDWELRFSTQELVTHDRTDS